MSLSHEFEIQGNWLFRRRSILPLTFLPFLVVGIEQMRWPFGSYLLHEWWEHVCVGISIAGIVIRVLTVGHAPARTSGRNTEGQVADSLNTTGVYSLVRHPLYLGNFLIGLGVVLVPVSWWLSFVYCLAFWLYYERIMFAEEVFLQRRFRREFIDWARETPAFIPKFSGYRRPSTPFSLRNVLRREYTAVAVLALMHSGVEEFENWVFFRKFVVEPEWVLLLATALITYFVLRTLNRSTTLLDVAGR